MEINEFIQETLSQIVQGVANVNNSFAEQEAYVASKDINGGNAIYRKEGNTMKNVVMVDFDLAVTVSQKDEKNKGVGASLNIASLGFDADIGKRGSCENQQTSRVKFSLPLILKDDGKLKAIKRGVHYQ